MKKISKNIEKKEEERNDNVSSLGSPHDSVNGNPSLFTSSSTNTQNKRTSAKRKARDVSLLDINSIFHVSRSHSDSFKYRPSSFYGTVRNFSSKNILQLSRSAFLVNDVSNCIFAASISSKVLYWWIWIAKKLLVRRYSGLVSTDSHPLKEGLVHSGFSHLEQLGIG